MPARILIVDDEVDLPDLVRRKFRREIRHGDFELLFAADGVEALEKVREDPEIDLVVTDINMPRMDGLTLLDHLDAYEDRLRSIIISAYGDMDNIRAAMNRGAADFVTKPIDFQDLLITIKKTLDHLDDLKHAVEERMAADRARANLARYFSPSRVATLVDRDEPFGPPRLQDIAVLFADIRGFTALSETLPPEEVMTLLRDYHARMENIVFAHGGTLESIMGDGLFATFGTPDVGDRDAADAFACGRAMIAAVAEWNAERERAGGMPIRIGVGVNYGPAVLGDIGGERSMTFTAIGDTVNVASRLESLTRTLNADIVISEAAVRQARRELGDDASVLDALSEAGEQPVKGRAGTIKAFYE